MTHPNEAIRAVESAFGGNAYPGDRWLLGSMEEPYEEVLAFQGRTDWRSIEPAFLDMHAGALSFFSKAGFRFFLPAYLEEVQEREEDRREQIAEALDGYWRERASNAPEAVDLERHNEAMRMITGEGSCGG